MDNWDINSDESFSDQDPFDGSNEQDDHQIWDSSMSETNDNEFLGENDNIGEIIGAPEEWAYYYNAQTLPDTCAIVAQQGILKTFGIDVTETELVQFAEESGIYAPGNGTTMEDVGDILDSYGIQNARYSGAGLDNLIEELQQGNRVIVGLDANEIWTPESSLNPFNDWTAELPDAGHAVWVTGIDIDKGVVYTNDSGVPDGQAREVEIADFLNAWEDYNNFYCATRV